VFFETYADDRYDDNLPDNDADDEYYLNNIGNLILGYLKSFFSNKNVDPGVYSSKDCINLVQYTYIEEAVPVVYEMLGYTDTSSILRVLKECGRLGIPQRYSGGILLIYFQFCVLKKAG